MIQRISPKFLLALILTQYAAFYIWSIAPVNEHILPITANAVIGATLGFFVFRTLKKAALFSVSNIMLTVLIALSVLIYTSIRNGHLF